MWKVVLDTNLVGIEKYLYLPFLIICTSLSHDTLQFANRNVNAKTNLLRIRSEYNMHISLQCFKRSSGI